MEKEKSYLSLIALSYIFPIPNIQKTAAFYESVLGFRAVECLECKEPCICLYQDNIEILLLQSNSDRIQPNRKLYGCSYEAYIYCDDQKRFEQELSAKG